MPLRVTDSPAKRICLTGGGTAGHVVPHFALLPEMKGRGYEVFYIGSSGMEEDLVRAKGIPFYRISAGKLRRYFSLQNAVDVFKLVWGVLQAFFILLKKRPDLVFSKGGFVAVPVCLAAAALRIPVISHESDLTPGLATKIIQRFARKILYTFPETGPYLRAGAVYVGTPVRHELFQGDKERGRVFAGFEKDPKAEIPTILLMGGSLGAQRLNEALLAILPDLMVSYRVLHLTGKGKGIDFHHERYRAFDYVGDELKDLFAMANLVVSRAGANAIFEILALQKPMLLIPLEIGSRGDQVRNAESFVEKGWAKLMRETDLGPSELRMQIDALARDAVAIRKAQQNYHGEDVQKKILDLLTTA